MGPSGEQWLSREGSSARRRTRHRPRSQYGLRGVRVKHAISVRVDRKTVGRRVAGRGLVITAVAIIPVQPKVGRG
eukprot:14277638-Heterocapsa_arctica.AAC.1